MIKIFNKLRLIITLSIILITILFGFLVQRQYQIYHNSSKNISDSQLAHLEQCLQKTVINNKNITDLFYANFIKYNSELINTIIIYNNDINKNKNSIKELIEKNNYGRLTGSFGTPINAIEFYDPDKAPIAGYYATDTFLPAYSQEYPLADNERLVGYVRLSYPVDDVIRQAKKNDHCQPFFILNTSRINDQTLNSPTFQDSYAEFFARSGFVVQQKHFELTSAGYNKEVSLAYYRFHDLITSNINSKLTDNISFMVNNRIDNKYYSMAFIPFSTNPAQNIGYYVVFNETPALTRLHFNYFISTMLLIVLYIALLFIVGFIFYIINYMYHFTYTDNLTKAYNRHKFYEIIPRIFYEYKRYGYTFSLILIDIDNFKNINDNFGHNVGDSILIKLVENLSTALRASDYLFRWGGEEFLVLLPHCSLDNAVKVAEKLRKMVENMDFQTDHASHLTISLGVSSVNENDDIKILINQADKAMYQSKSKGKNCVTAYHGEVR